MTSLYQVASESSGGKKKPPSKKPAPSGWTKMKHALARVTNLSDAVSSVGSYTRNSWVRDHAIQYKSKERQCAELERQLKISTKSLARLQTKKDNTSPRIQSAELHGKTSTDGELQWSMKDRVLISVTLLGAITAVCLGGINVYANLKAAELPVFIESPYLAVTLAFLLPVGSLAIKFMTGMFEYDKHRRMFELAIYVLTIFLVFIWSYLFAQSFASITGTGLNLNTLLNENDHGSMLLVWVQTLTELTAGSALFIAADSISAKHNPRITRSNPDYLAADAALAVHLAAHNTLSDQIGQLEGELAAMNAESEVLINERTADFLSYHERLNSVDRDDQ